MAHMNQVHHHVTQALLNEGSGPYCNKCNNRCQNLVHEEDTTNQWIWCIILLLFTGVCCWIPFCIDSCKRQVVRCGTCRTIINAS
mmetsp:Transcript_2165/g.3795  ORF Transcript_2165/g.3795 Transcript_2165/m.3795 type:complete len:85 (+) Transcript_2165:165-419(+)